MICKSQLFHKGPVHGNFLLPTLPLVSGHLNKWTCSPISRGWTCYLSWTVHV